ncbi:conserved hypothetical protein [Neospora caninum Liverpool]|uniref:Uncharacterized protein n=1 Tax=Neospora caninum (strain Liverpool) TaxID=572307 RepID=F0VQ03_NEOCL|nr:conserved hypothetical protein [Neospora caninum Liverpool]CBZ55800.1 conserved hypothetical protein [Neospora caninum Liverpool]CEL70542.1 TPA: hypothetical protein BN1204_062260 [Neospora caninum Liverpool]|eukprot:XP_003885826.1 conserved hypothetical protein [Neospora caninum Liverpool]
MWMCLVASSILLLLSDMQSGQAGGYLGPTVMPQFMSPQRPGNENLPPNTVVAPVAQNIGLQYPPWSGSDADDLEYPTVNVHYDFEPKDWNKKREELRDRIALRRERNKFLANADQDQMDLADVIEGQNSQLQGMSALLVEQALQARNTAAGVVEKKIPEAIKTGTALGTNAMAQIESRLNSMYPPPLHKNKSFSGPHIRSYSATPDIFEHLADELTVM